MTPFNAPEPASQTAIERVKEEAGAWILREPAVTLEEAAQRGLSTADIDELSKAGKLIVLKRPDGGYQIPSFQLDDSGRIKPVVADINAMFDAHDDPWGTAEWWMGANAYTPGNIPPCRLLGTEREPELADLANVGLNG
jgi:hypothetical protein